MDLLFCANLYIAGIKSQARRFLSENAGIEPVSYPEFIYRTTVTQEKMISTLATARLMESQHTQSYLGPGKWVLGYPIAGGRLYNAAFLVSDRDLGIPLGINSETEVANVREDFKKFCPEVTALAGIADKCFLWPSGELPRLKTWVSKSGRLVLVGDAAVSI